MSSTRIEALVDAVQAAFDRPPTELEPGLDVDDAALLQLRKACRLLAGLHHSGAVIGAHTRVNGRP